MIPASEISGFIASALVLTTFAMKDMRLLRITAILSNIAFIIYGVANGLVPVGTLHVLLLPLNLYRLRDCSGAQKVDTRPVHRKGDRATDMAIEALYLGRAMRDQPKARSKCCRRPYYDRSTRLCVH